MGPGGSMGLVSEQAADGISKPLPQRAMVRQRALAAARHLVDAPLAPGVGGGPLAREEPRLLQPVQRRIDRAFRQVEGAAALLPDLLDDAIAMRGAARERREHDHVEMAF